MTRASVLKTALRRVRNETSRRLGQLAQHVEARRERHLPAGSYDIELTPGAHTAVEEYWTKHTVNSIPFHSAAASVRYLEWRSSQYPLFHELMGLWGEHAGDTVLDYGCGPGNDLVGFLVNGRARQVIGIDISTTSLELARGRLGLHAIEPTRVRLIKASDDDPSIPLATGSVDYIYCQGVLHHTSHPEAIVAEFRRVLRPGGTAAIMVYNHDSLWLHLYVAYERQIKEGIDSDQTVEVAFGRSTDGEACPIATPYRPAEFARLCEGAGFAVDYRGGYFSQLELDLWRSDAQQAIADGRLGGDHRDFLLGLVETNGRPCHGLFPAGVGGVYILT